MTSSDTSKPKASTTRTRAGGSTRSKGSRARQGWPTDPNGKAVVAKETLDGLGALNPLELLQADPASRRPLTERQAALVAWWNASEEELDEELAARGQKPHHDSRKGKLAVLSGYGEHRAGYVTMRKDLRKPHVRLALVAKVQERVLDHQTDAVEALADIATGGRSEAQRRGSANDLLRLGGAFRTAKDGGGSGGNVSISITLAPPEAPADQPPTIDAEAVGSPHDDDEG